MGFVSGFVDTIVVPLQTTAGQIRQVSSLQSEANTSLLTRARNLTMTSFQGNGMNAFMLMTERQYEFAGNTIDMLSTTASIMEQTASTMKNAAEEADMLLGGWLLGLADRVLHQVSPDAVVSQGNEAISAIINNMRQEVQAFLNTGHSFLDDIVHGYFSAAFQEATAAFGDLAQLAGDFLTMLSQVETILGEWAGRIMLASNVLQNELQSLVFTVGDKLLGLSDLAENSAILADPNSTDTERAIAVVSIGVTIAGDILLFIPGGEEGKVAAEGMEEADKLTMQEAEDVAEQDIVKATEQKGLETPVDGEVPPDSPKSFQDTVDKLFPPEEEGWFKRGLRLTGNALNGDIISPVFHKVLEDNAKTITTWVVDKGLVLGFGKDEAEKLLENELTRTLARIAQDKTLEFFSQWAGGPYKQFIMGQINESQLQNLSRELASQVYSS